MVFLRVRPRLMTKGGERTDHLSICDQRKLYLKNGIEIDKRKSYISYLNINLRSLMRRRHREKKVYPPPFSLKSKEEIAYLFTMESTFFGIEDGRE